MPLSTKMYKNIFLQFIQTIGKFGKYFEKQDHKHQVIFTTSCTSDTHILYSSIHMSQTFAASCISDPYEIWKRLTEISRRENMTTACYS